MANYVIDTNTISQLIKNPSKLLKVRFADAVAEQGVLYVSDAVRYEVERGLRKKQAMRQLETFQKKILPVFAIVPVDWVIWDAAADLWVVASSRGRQLADIDLIVAATALRLDAVIVSHDRDYSVFAGIQTENWIDKKNI